MRNRIEHERDKKRFDCISDESRLNRGHKQRYLALRRRIRSEDPEYQPELFSEEVTVESGITQEGRR